MSLTPFFKKVRELIAKDELEEAFNRLQAFLKGSPKLDETIVQSARHRDVLKQLRLGAIDFQQANLTKNQIRSSLLELIRELENFKYLEENQTKDYNYIVKKIADNRGAGTSEVLNNKSTNDLDEKELATLFKQERVEIIFDNLEAHPKEMNIHQKLLMLSLAENGHIFKGTFLCLGKHNQIHTICHTAIESKFIQFKGTDRAIILVLESLRGNLLRQYEKMLLLLRTYIPLGRDRVNSEDVYEIPIAAVREFVANAFVHRDYGNEVKSYIQVELFDDRLEIKSPGQLPKNVDVLKIEGTVLINPSIAAIFHLYKYIERAGTGIQVAQQALKKAGLKPARIENIQNPQMVKVTIYRNRHEPPTKKGKGLFHQFFRNVKQLFS